MFSCCRGEIPIEADDLFPFVVPDISDLDAGEWAIQLRRDRTPG